MVHGRNFMVHLILTVLKVMVAGSYPKGSNSTNSKGTPKELRMALVWAFTPQQAPPKTGYTPTGTTQHY